FDDDQEFQEEIDLIDEPEILDVESEAKLNQIKINIPQVCDRMVENIKIALFNALNYYWEYLICEALLATLLDPRTKKMELATYSQRLEAEAYLITEYEAFKEQEPIPMDTIQIDDDPDEEENVLLAAMYESIQESDTNTEIQVYLALPRIPNTQ
ncbi:11810_t:CDS:1, partial [Racocetra persica]